MGKVLSVFYNGFPGTVSRAVDQIIASFGNKETENPIPFGGPVMLTSNGNGVLNFTTEIASDQPTAARILGIAIRTSKTPDGYGESEGRYNPGDVTEVLTRGTCTVKVKSGIPHVGDKVYWTPEGFTPTYTEHQVCEITNMRWKSIADLNNHAEVVITDRSL